jgi:hypothetical protein
MIQIAQDNALTPVELDKLFTQEEQKALQERGFLGTPVPAPTVEKAPTAGELLVAYLESIIDKRVEEKVSQIMSSHATIALISTEQREMMQELVDDAINVHLSDIDHDEFLTTEGVNNIVENAISDIDFDNAVRSVLDSTNTVEDIVDNKIDDIDWEEKVREGLTSIIG